MKKALILMEYYNPICPVASLVDFPKQNPWGMPHTFENPCWVFDGSPSRILQIFRKSVPVVWGKQVWFLGTLNFAYVEETKDKMKKNFCDSL